MRKAAFLILALRTAAFAGDIEFNRDVRPILSDKCFHCHGADAAAKKIPLRLDSEAAAKQVIAPGDPAKSLLIQRITAEKATQRMPPAYSGLKLTAPEIETLRQWIAQGAAWQKHWSFLPPKRPDLPPVKDAAWPRNPIDRFIEARLEKEGLSHSPEADRERLLRRASLDLTGLPPTPAETAVFLKDASPKAYEKAVDRLLASPRYGERMAARWLDAARYADSNGYQYDGERVMWRWRDWVIDAFNRNQPFNQFTLEQIAGDLLPNATMEQKMATGFQRNHRANTEDGIIPEEYAVEYVVDRVETNSTVFMGVTLGCARCHNHKYDPFTQKEFYQMFAYFNNVPELGRAMKYGNSPPVVPAPTREQQQTMQALNAKLAQAESHLHKLEQSTTATRRKWERELAAKDPVFWAPANGLAAEYPIDSLTAKAKGELTFTTSPVGKAAVLNGKSYIEDPGAGAFDIEDQFSMSAWVYAESVDGSLITRMKDDPKGKGYGLHLDHGKLHVNFNSTYADDAIRIETEESLSPRRWYHITMTYSGSRMAEGISLYLDGKPMKTKVLLDTLYRPFRNAGAVFKEPLRIGAGWGTERRFQGAIADARLYSRILQPLEITALSMGESLNAIANKPEAERKPAEATQLRNYYLEHEAPSELRRAAADLSTLLQQKETLERTFPTVMVMAERPVPKDTFLLIRGAYDKPGEKVEPGTPAILPPLPADAPKNRLALANWLVDSNNPLLARVTVNRFWQMYFGTGLVKTTEDFGAQGEFPSHPELLDWLATEFIRTGWDVKALQKLIVTSATYRQSSQVTPELTQRDPENRLLARGPRTRLPAEMVRDQALYHAGLLVEKLGGPSVKPYQPAGLWKEISMQDMDYIQSKGSDLYRRSLYTFWKRTIAPPMMMNFDAAPRESCVVRETRTNTPLQALNLMNDVTFLEAARFIGRRMLKEGGNTPDARLAWGFRLVTGRTPSKDEVELLHGSLQYHLDYFATKTDAQKAYLNQGDTAAESSPDLAAYAAIGSLLLNLDETVTKE